MMANLEERRQSSQAARPLPPTQQDAADLQRLIRYVERWRMAHFQRTESGLRMADADVLLRKMRSGLQLAIDGGAAMAALDGQPQSRFAF